MIIVSEGGLEGGKKRAGAVEREKKINYLHLYILVSSPLRVTQII